MDNTAPTPEKRNPESLADILPLRVQAGLFVLLAGLLGFIAWTAWQPVGPPPTVRPALVDLNRADREALLTLHGIGPELADRILAYRDVHGNFDSLTDLRKVNGIGPAKLEQLRPQVSLSWPGAADSSTEPAYVAAALERKPAGSMIDPNTATLAELGELPGIGPVKAQRIIDRRPFATINDLRKVPGIGPKTFDSIKARIAISDASNRLQ